VEAALLAKLNADEAVLETPKPKSASLVPKPLETKDSKVQKSAVSEKELSPNPALAETKPEIISEVQVASIGQGKVVLPPPVSTEVEAKSIQPIPGDKGIGGHQHNLIRERIETVARQLGFHAAREKLTATGQKIDLALEKGGQVIACEISIMTTVDHEVGNVSKCLKAGCRHVAVICVNEARLAKIQTAVLGCLSAEEVLRVAYYLPDQFIDYLQKLRVENKTPTDKQETVLGKYKVKSRASKLSPEETKAREAAALKMLAETMRRKK
jgi:hypothetical protein